ncbi:S8 family peptidase [Mesorhizobium kowhaii]|uniref:S8 family peptidase n=1 Tax=Mesorhizobium kowhaii TaxID=1300272 RepID=UPI0035EDDE0A
MADSNLYRHVHLRGLGVRSKNFTAPGGGGAKRRERVADRRLHAENLLSQVSDMRSLLDDFNEAQKANRVPSKFRGIPIAIEGRPAERLEVSKKQRSTTRGLKLLNVRRAPGSNEADEERNSIQCDRAVFFATRSMLKSLEEALHKYGEWEGGDAGIQDYDDDDDGSRSRPRNFWLFESSDTIREATLQDLWTDPLNRFPRRRTKHDWEVWLRPDLEQYFLRALNDSSIETVGNATVFVESIVRTVHAAAEELNQVLRASGAIVSLRSASSFASDFSEMPKVRRALALDAIAQRIVAPPADAPRVTVLDTGVKRTHPLLRPMLPGNRCFSADPTWDNADHNGHGTRMAGLAQYGDMDVLVSGTMPIIASTALESVVVNGPDSGVRVPARDAVRRAVDVVEADAATRVFCLAQTAAGESEKGVPTSTSSVVDDLAFGDGNRTRLFVVAVGNAPHHDDEPYQKADYDRRNIAFPVQSPAQSLNALAVGAVSLKRHGRGRLLAPVGDLAPTSRTSEGWPSFNEAVRFCKPDIVMEGGNFLIEDGDVFCRPSHNHMVLTTGINTPAEPFAYSGETSTATALASHLAAKLLARYPAMRMETVRALMANAADWTPAMLAHYRNARRELGRSSGACAQIISRFGWGVPNEERLFASAGNALTLVVEDKLQPYEMADGHIRLKEMKYFKLPWPTEILRSLRNTQVEMRCTLSYFVEPEPHAASRDRLDRYPSHRLKFEVKRFGESDASAKRRVNWAEPPDNLQNATDDGWLLGDRQRGSLIQDIWHGEAYKLAARDAISVSPVHGWWGEITSAERYDREVNFSLVVSIRTPEESGDLMAEVRNKIPATLLVEPIRAVT